jgi:hypothetical protein
MTVAESSFAAGDGGCHRRQGFPTQKLPLHPPAKAQEGQSMMI